MSEQEVSATASIVLDDQRLKHDKSHDGSISGEDSTVYIPGEQLYNKDQVGQLLNDLKEAVVQSGKLSESEVEKQFQDVTVLAGSGVYELDGQFFASVVGVSRLTSAGRLLQQMEAQEISLPEAFSRTLKQVHPASLIVEIAKTGTDASMRLPRVGSVVTGKITRITANVATMDILVVDGKSIVSQQRTFRGIIRKENIRETEVDKVKMHECYRPDDLVSAEVVSLGDARSYFLSTVKVEMGVIFAKSDAGFPMSPVSWEEMVCTKTGMREKRKVAKVEPDGNKEK